ncbi:unnamed protein product [Pocillopora meandrina]|uniref:Thioesterase domain-containing protein n=1 Tax=Pocillopora meandrina TaxID=46732 RepID=A0AAU9WCB7_9CNID|nr:unnamed protein product [Pocillopora meandrina]
MPSPLCLQNSLFLCPSRVSTIDVRVEFLNPDMLRLGRKTIYEFSVRVTRMTAKAECLKSESSYVFSQVKRFLTTRAIFSST